METVDDILGPQSVSSAKNVETVDDLLGTPDELGIGEELRGVYWGAKRGARRFVQQADVAGIRKATGDLPEQLQKAEAELKQFDVEFPNATAETHPSGYQWRQKQLGKIGELRAEKERYSKMAPALAESLANQQKEIENIPLTEAQADFFKPETPWWKFFDNPFELTAITAAESAPSMIGAIAGSPLGPLGTAAGAGISSRSAESSSRIISAMQKADVDVKNPKAVLQWFADKSKSDPEIAKADLAALGPAAFDTLTAGIGGRWLKEAIGKGIKPVVGATLKEMGVQMTGGGAGSIVGSWLAGEPVDWKDVALEVASEFAPIEAVANVRPEIQEQVGRKRRLTLANDLRSSPEWKGYIAARGEEKLPDIAKARAEAARNRVNTSVADRTEVRGEEVRLAGARDRMADFGYIFDEAADVYRPARPTQGGQNANQTGTPTQAASTPAGPVEETAGSLRVRNAPQNRVEAKAGEAPAEDVAKSWQVTVQSPQELAPGKTVPGYVQIDDIAGGKNNWSKTPETLAKEGIAVPDFSQLPQGKYTYEQALALLKGGVPNVQEEKGRKAVLNPEAQDQPEPPKSQTIADPSQQPIFEVPLDQITLSKDVPNFKKKANESGVVEENKLGGKYERLGTAPIVLWKRKNGALEVITGRHRLDLARRSGEKTIPAQIVEEEKGFTRQQALVFDAASNIRDGQGDVEDYADFFRNTPNINETEALKGGLLARAKGRSGWNIGKSASDDVFALFKAGKISSAQAEAISLAAPNNTSAQAIGSRYAVIGRDPDFVSNIIKASLNQARVQNVDLDLFGNDNSAMAAMEETAYAASKIVSGLRDQIQAVSNAAKRPKLAAKLGVDVKDPAGVQDRIKQLRADLERWNNWPTQPDLVAQLKASTSQPQPVSPTPAPSIQPSQLPENEAFVNSPEGRGEVQLPKADPAFLQWKQRLKGKRNLAQPSPGLSGKALQRYYQLRDKESLTLPEQREFERLSNVNQGGLFQDEAATAVQQSAKLRAAQLRQQAEENERLAGLRYDAYSRGSQKAYGEYQAYTKEADRLRKLAVEFDKQAGVYTRSELPQESKRQSPQLDLFGGANLTLPDGSYNPSVRRNRRIVFNTSDNGFTITYGKNEFGEGTREIRVATPEDLMFLVSHESLNISDDLRAALKGIAASNMVKHFPGLGFAITTFVEGSVPGGATYRGEHLPEQRLIRLLNAASAKDAAHEFMHHLQYYLRPEDREWIRVQRQLAIRRELRKTRNSFEIGTLENLLKEQLSSDAYLEQRHSRDLYHLANEFEFWAWMMTDRAASEFTQPTERGFIQRIRDAIKQWFYALRKYANLTSRDEEIWNQVIKGTYTYSADMRFQYNQEAGRNLAVPSDEPAYNMGDRLDIETAWAQIDKASRLTIPELAQSKLDDYRSAISELEANEFDTKRYRAANDKLKELAAEAQKLAMRSGDEFWETEDGQAWLSPSNENFGAALFRLNVAFDPEALRGLQIEIRFERRSRNLSGMRRRLQATEQTIETLQSMGWEAGDYLEFTKTAERLRKSIGKLESDPDADNAGGLTVSERADQIDELRGSMVELRAKRDALNLPFVYEVFESDDEAGGVPVERLSQALKGFTAAMNDGNLHQSYKDASAKLLWDNLSKLEMAQKEFSKFSDARRQQISKAIRSARVKLADANIEYGIQKIFEDELLRVANNNERGLTGTLSGREAANFLKESFGTMIAFANNLRAAYPGGGAEAVLMRVLGGLSSPDPGKFSPENSYFGSVEKLTAELSKTTDPDLAAIRRGAGVADYALARILFVLARSPKLEDATGALIRYARRQLAADPTNQLDTIGNLLDSGDAFKIAEATDMVNRLAAQSRQQQSAIGSQIASIEKELTDASVALEALDYGKALFDEVTGTPEDRNPEYIQIRDKAIEWLNIRERMILSSGGNPRKFGDTSVGFQPFAVKTHDLEIKQDLLVIDAANEAVNKESNFARIQKWFKNANDYVLAFREADAAFQQDPVNNKSPDALGFDRVTYNGLEDAIAQEARYLDPVILFIDQKTENNLLTQWALGKAYFRQYLASVKEVNGQAGRDLLSAMTRYGNALNRSKVAYHNHIYEIRDARLAAVKSHGDFCNGDLEIYRKKIFNEMASEGRQFGESVKVGMTLPVSGEKVTFEDIKLLKTLQAFYGDLRQLVTETEGRGVIEERGHAKAGTFRVFVRKAASVGEEGLPMTISGEGENLIKELTEAYVSEGEAGWPTASSDLSRNSGNRAVQFWNRHSDSLTRHILDAGRKFRSITQDRLMLIAEQRAAQELRQTNNPLAIQSLEDAIALIAKHLPEEARVDPIAFVSERLLEELHQYYVNTGSPAANMLPKSQGVGGMTIRSEFTQPAAQYHFPSDWYDYGSFTNSGLILMTARVMHEPIIEVNKALQRALAAIQGEINLVVEKRGKPVNYRNEREALRVKAIVEGAMGDLEKSWNLTDPDVARNGLELPPDIIKAGLLAPPTVNTRNLINGGGLVMLNLMQLHRWGRTMAMLGTFRHVAGAAARLPVDLMFSQNWPVGRFLKPYLVDNLRSFGSPMMTWLADKIVQSHVDNVAGLQSIGFSLRSPFLRSVMSMWKDTALYQTSLSGHLRRGKMAVTGRVLSNVVRTGTAAYRAIGAEYFDKIINSQSIGYTGTIEATLMELSDIYGAKREFLGEYNPADRKWLITPEEFSRRLLETDRVQNLAQFKAFLSGADMTLEDLMWKYYKAKKAFQKGERATEPSMFNEDQYNALRAAVVRAFNAGDALNRPTAIANNRFFRMFATFQGYSSNFLVNYMQAFNRARSQSWYENAAMAIPASIMFAVTSVALALFSNAFNDEWKRKFQGSSQRQVTIFTKEFWTDYSNAKSAVLEAYLSMIPWLGDTALFARGVVVNNRGYEPTGRILVFGLMNGLFSTIRGMWNTAKAGDYANMMNPARDYLLQYAGYGKEIAYATSETYKAVKDYRAGQSVLGYVAEQNGIKDPKASQGSSNFVYGPTSGLREDMQSALMRRDSGALREAYAKMVAYYTNRGMKDPESIVNRDFEAMNPIIRGMGGKKLTTEQYDLIYSKLTDAQKESVNASLKAWDWGANALGIQYNPISGQGGGSLRAPSVGRQASLSRASSSGSTSPTSFRVRRISIGSARKSIGSRSRRLGIRRFGVKARQVSRRLVAGPRRPTMRRLRLV